MLMVATPPGMQSTAAQLAHTLADLVPTAEDLPTGIAYDGEVELEAHPGPEPEENGHVPPSPSATTTS